MPFIMWQIIKMFQNLQNIVNIQRLSICVHKEFCSMCYY